MRIKIIACLTSSLFLAMTTTLAMAANTSNSTPNSNDAVHQCVSSIKSAAGCVTHGRCALCLKEVYAEDAHWKSKASQVCPGAWILPLAVACGIFKHKQTICDAAAAEINPICE